VQSTSQPWMNGAIRKALNNRYEQLQKAKRTGKGSPEWKAYKKARNQCSNVIKSAKAQHWKINLKMLTHRNLFGEL